MNWERCWCKSVPNQITNSAEYSPLRGLQRGAACLSWVRAWNADCSTAALHGHGHCRRGTVCTMSPHTDLITVIVAHPSHPCSIYWTNFRGTKWNVLHFWCKNFLFLIGFWNYWNSTSTRWFAKLRQKTVKYKYNWRTINTFTPL